LAPERAAAIRRSGARLVLPEEGGDLAFDVGPEIQVDHLIARGHTRIAYASTHVHGMEQMNAGRLSRVSDLAQHKHLTLRTAVLDDRNAKDVVAAWLADGVTGVVAFNDDTAADVVGAAIRLGAAVPTDLAVIGHDDSPIAGKMVPSLSTVHFNIAGLGRHFALRALAAARNEPLPLISPPDVRAHLVHRESS
jgi:DNA-binding LacI/PurR family transcriptional regulator